MTSIEYRGDVIDLTTATAGSVNAVASADGSSYTYSVSLDGDQVGELTLVNNTDSSTLTFNSEGFYRYVPATVPTAVGMKACARTSPTPSKGAPSPCSFCAQRMSMERLRFGVFVSVKVRSA